MTFLRGSIYGALLAAILIAGLYVVPVVIANSGVVAPMYSLYSINIGSFEAIQFSIAHPSKLTGFLVSSRSISVYIVNETQFGSIQQFGYPQAYVYSLGNSDSFSINAGLPGAGMYYLVFYSMTYFVQQPVPIRIMVTRALVARPF